MQRIRLVKERVRWESVRSFARALGVVFSFSFLSFFSFSVVVVVVDVEYNDRGERHGFLLPVCAEVGR